MAAATAAINAAPSRALEVLVMGFPLSSSRGVLARREEAGSSSYKDPQRNLGAQVNALQRADNRSRRNRPTSGSSSAASSPTTLLTSTSASSGLRARQGPCM